MANVSELITLGVGTPSSIPYFIRLGLGQVAAPVTTKGGGGARPMRGGNGREWNYTDQDRNRRGNVQTIYRGRDVALKIAPAVLHISATCKLTHYVRGTAPRIAEVFTPPLYIAEPIRRRLRLEPVVLHFSASAYLSYIPAAVELVTRSETQSAARANAQTLRMDRIETFILGLQDEIEKLYAENEGLSRKIASVTDELISFQDDVLSQEGT